MTPFLNRKIYNIYIVIYIYIYLYYYIKEGKVWHSPYTYEFNNTQFQYGYCTSESTCVQLYFPHSFAGEEIAHTFLAKCDLHCSEHCRGIIVHKCIFV